MDRLIKLTYLTLLILTLLITAGCDTVSTGYHVALYNPLYLEGGVPCTIILSTYSEHIENCPSVAWAAKSGKYSDCEAVNEPICIHAIGVDDQLALYDAISCIFDEIDIDELCSSDAMLELTSKGSTRSLGIIVHCVDSCTEAIFHASQYANVQDLDSDSSALEDRIQSFSTHSFEYSPSSNTIEKSESTIDLNELSIN